MAEVDKPERSEEAKASEVEDEVQLNDRITLTALQCVLDLSEFLTEKVFPALEDAQGNGGINFSVEALAKEFTIEKFRERKGAVDRSHRV